LITAATVGTNNIVRAGQAAGYGAELLAGAQTVQPLLMAREGYITYQGILATDSAIANEDYIGAIVNGTGTVLGGLGTAYSAKGTYSIFEENFLVGRIYPSKTGSFFPEGYIGAEGQLQYRGPILGGSYRDVRAANVGGDVHHMPANSASPLSRQIGPGIYMPTLDHARTASFAGNPGSRQYIARQRELIGQGRFNEAVQMDIIDVQGLFGNKYEEHIRQMLDWIRLSRSTPGR
jgi:hypothetical protein